MAELFVAHLAPGRGVRQACFATVHVPATFAELTCLERALLGTFEAEHALCRRLSCAGCVGFVARAFSAVSRFCIAEAFIVGFEQLSKKLFVVRLDQVGSELVDGLEKAGAEFVTELERAANRGRGARGGGASEAGRFRHGSGAEHDEGAVSDSGRVDPALKDQCAAQASKAFGEPAGR